MRLSRRVALDGAQLDEVDSRIVIQAVECGQGKDTISLTQLPGGGSRVTSRGRESVDITIRFSIHARRDAMAERHEVFEKIVLWANRGGWLTTSERPLRRIRVFLAQAPAAGDMWQWTNIYALTFRSCGNPYWQELYPSELQTPMSGSITKALGVPGNAAGPIEFSFRNTGGGTVDSFDITAGGYSIHLRGLGLASGQTLTLDHADDGERYVQRIRIGSRSVLGCRTADSHDELMAEPGSVQVTASGGNGVLTISAGGRYL